MKAYPFCPFVVAGASFFFAGEYPSHLWFIVSNPIANCNQVLVVNLTSYDEFLPPGAYNDPACLIQPADHPYPYVTHASCICYGGALVASVSHLEFRFGNGEIDIKDPASAVLLDRIRQCAGDSRYMEPDHFEILVSQGLAA